MNLLVYKGFLFIPNQPWVYTTRLLNSIIESTQLTNIPMPLSNIALSTVAATTIITISAAKMQDLEALNALMYDLHLHHHLATPDFFKTPEEIEQEKSIARYLDDPECLVYVAKQDKTIIGFITGHFCELIATVSKPVQMGSIDELFVLDSHRHLKVAQALYERLEQTFEEYGVQQVFVEVWDFNQPAHQFYQKVGFESHIHWLRKPLRSL